MRGDDGLFDTFNRYGLRAGIGCCGRLPKNFIKTLAVLSDRFSLIRSMTHGEREHEPGSHAMLAGLPRAPANASERANRSTDLAEWRALVQRASQ